MSIVIVIPTHNRKEALKILLNRLFSELSKAELNASFFIVVVVDGSCDGTFEMLEEEFDSVEIVKGDGSWWYTKSMNAGFRYAKKHNPDFILTLNDDVLPGEHYFESILRDYYKQENINILGSVSFTTEKPNRILSSGNYWKSKKLGALKSYIPLLKIVDIDQMTGIRETETLPGRGMLIPYTILEELNYFDEKFIQYHSDGDFCLRAKKKGYPVYISYNCKLFLDARTTSKSTSFINRSFTRLIKSYFDNKSRNYLPAKFRFARRHQGLLIAPLILVLFIVVTVKNLVLVKKY